MGIHDQQRLTFVVVSWCDKLKEGSIMDAQRVIYKVGLKNLSSPDCDGVLFPGETVEGVLHDSETVLDIMGTSALQERPTNESVGASGGVRGWTPITGDSRYNPAL